MRTLQRSIYLCDLEVPRSRGHRPAFAGGGVHDAESHNPYPLEFKLRLVEMERAGRNPDELAEKFEPTAQSIRN
jgi:hypothetical protein